MKQRAAVVLPEAIRQALSWFDSFTAENLLDRFLEHRDAPRPGGRFAFHAYVQQPLTLAFLLARAGRADEARRALEAWAADHVSEATHEELRALLVDAAPRSAIVEA
ncbi:MAG: hypothetical protein JST00_32755 [Deltaproteobacteria bacterium]|nr:hypothetical protein [Deltaproteobacteria bacterium]